MRYTIINLGCKVNRVESDTIAAQLEDRGAITDDRYPDVVVINTCTVTGEAEKKTRKTVRRALRDFMGARSVVVTGCAAALDPDEFLSMDERVVVCGKNQVADTCFEAVHEEPLIAEEVRRHLRFGGDFPTRVGLKIQDGCSAACTFCIVHVARGKAFSRPLPDVLREAHELYGAGVREVVLTGINLGTYTSNNANLAKVVQQLIDEMPKLRVRISSIEPLHATDELIEVLSRQEGRVCRHLHLPLQSGSSKVLHEMARPYSAEQFLSIVERIRTAVPEVSLSTDIIVGFPGETDQDFQATLDMVRACRFSKVHVFRYSKRAGTPAAARTDQIDSLVSANRSHILSELAREVRWQEATRRIGTSEDVLVESHGLGMSESYYPVSVDPAIPRGSLARMHLKSFDSHGTFQV
ncbi:tRNA (N(6)-L-threonylcarbamoyladenosine(37)-C(2))-methylthiotransferase MtaB [Cryptobacterium curtum]